MRATRPSESQRILMERVVAGGIVVCLCAYLYDVGLEQADQLASVISAVVAVAVLLRPYILNRKERPVSTDEQQGDPPQPVRQGHSAGRDVTVERGTVVALVAIIAILAAAAVAVAAVWFFGPKSETATSRAIPAQREPGPPAASSEPVSPAPSPSPSVSPSPSLPAVTVKQTSTETRPLHAAAPRLTTRTKTTPVAAPPPPTPHATEAAAPTGRTISINGDRLVDFDQWPPVITPVGSPESRPGTADVQVGPDNLYPHNGAENWFRDSGTCADTHAAHGSKNELVLKAKLAGRPGGTVTVCLRTTGGAYHVLRISTDQADGGGNPYHFTIESDDSSPS
ncbi:hypothetical protein FHR83_003489 [Actinoplanes campanulatus]|uniref:Uncharacterized protein n=1 Tax=Actinoplanes campanulatus TaxID=113559 RepID=A0A7W5AHH9_9ACTN|nr:hypothetical protein [Actinoplanes campanulatus]MBB3095819.1 hypothetical protein [Actinoplanes campanulatus]GGN11800.1 hypothetical protein GCM10010109_22020 [Actinoplanes campanulatus]GID37086.1 hypothetical protein Aca09nite_35920 [Actinoplanes campanulatus]